jgi:hypothetical protein
MTDATSSLADMTTRTTRRKVTFLHPFLLKAVDRALPAGEYPVITDQELIEGLSFPVYRRISTLMLVPAQDHHAVETVTIDPLDLKAAQRRDAETVNQLSAKGCGRLLSTPRQGRVARPAGVWR